ncbi:tetratricopeptide repeat protein [Bradyrhizobium hereditatis]|uniref:tetratricopeptide repeat protein n=1 Tax=Bradyrhizobium hereditatis TaxID=2821405 RepID=UPI001CE29AF7
MRRITALAQEGRYGEAVALARKITAEAERTSGRQSVLTATSLVVLAQTLEAQGEMAEAERALRRPSPSAKRHLVQIIPTLPPYLPRLAR